MSEILRSPAPRLPPGYAHSCHASLPDWWEPHIRYDGTGMWPHVNSNRAVMSDKVGAVVRCSCGEVYEVQPCSGHAIWRPCGWLRRRRLRRQGVPSV